MDADVCGVVGCPEKRGMNVAGWATVSPAPGKQVILCPFHSRPEVIAMVSRGGRAETPPPLELDLADTLDAEDLADVAGLVDAIHGANLDVDEVEVLKRLIRLIVDRRAR
jgi:hypothetical protein